MHSEWRRQCRAAFPEVGCLCLHVIALIAPAVREKRADAVDLAHSLRYHGMFICQLHEPSVELFGLGVDWRR